MSHIFFQAKHTKDRFILKSILELWPLLFKSETPLVVFGYLCDETGEGTTEAVMLVVAGTVPHSTGYPSLTSPMY